MSRALKGGLGDLRAWVVRARSRIEKIVSGRIEAGQRIAPTRFGNNDEKIGCRLDSDVLITKSDGKLYRRMNLQVNKDAESKTLRDFAAKDPHKVWAQVDVEVEEPVRYENVPGMTKEAVEAAKAAEQKRQDDKLDSVFEQLEEQLD